ncbi:Retrovirus-related Pol polyprotein [Senna tora]|uniref:Retrovirus-related Pol polyprotein n=1 Tax=Senna tora TaxID=362788 RepID=A0A834WAH7_9FABA|nr:Retrovirus-related Pol polyprotein [Senna tora]
MNAELVDPREREEERRPNPEGEMEAVALTEKDSTRTTKVGADLDPSLRKEAEYEALIAGLRLAKELGAKRATVHSDSQLVAGQLNGTFDVKEPTIARKDPREENERADSLSKLASASARCGANPILKAALKTPSIDVPEEVGVIFESDDWRMPLRDVPDTGDIYVPADGDENTEPNDQLVGEPQVVDDAHLRRSSIERQPSSR